MTTPSPPSRRGDRNRRIAMWTFLGIAAFYLLGEHRLHALGFLPWLLFLACPLLHLFHHRGHGGHGGHASPSAPGRRHEPSEEKIR